MDTTNSAADHARKALEHLTEKIESEYDDWYAGAGVASTPPG